MKVKAVYRDLKDIGKTDFSAKIVELEVPDIGGVEECAGEAEKRIKEATPPGFVFETIELQLGCT